MGSSEEVEWVLWLLATILVGWVVWWWNEMWYAVPLMKEKASSGGGTNTNTNTSTSTKLPPGHMGLPFLGEMITFLWYFKFLRRPDDFINAKRRKYGDGIGLFRTHLFGTPSIIACGVSVNKFVFQTDTNFVLEWPSVEIVGADSVVAVHGKSHARLRSYVTNAINRPDSLRRLALLVQPRIVAALQSWAHKAHIKAQLEIKKVTFENVGKLFVSLEPGPLLNEMDKLFRGMIAGVRAYPLNFPGFAFHHGVQCRKKLEAIFWEELEKRKNRTNNGEVETIDLMDGLMRMKDDEGKQLSDREVIDNIVSLVVAGYESTSLASMWAFYYLAKFPNVLSKLREENMAVKKTKPGDFITSDDVSKLKYTNKVVEETLRMANIAAFVFRRIVKECDYKGYKFPKGWKVILWLRYMHTNPENFDDPMCFNPDRWNEAAKPGTYQVFGGGSRICAGNMLARMQLALFLHHLSTGYKWKLVNPESDLVYLPHPIPVDGVEVAFSKL